MKAQGTLFGSFILGQINWWGHYKNKKNTLFNFKKNTVCGSIVVLNLELKHST
jgi:hypothetical protein